VGINDNLADYRIDPVEGPSRRLSTTSDSLPTPTPVPTVNHSSNVNHSSYSFLHSSHTTRMTRTNMGDKPRLQPSSRSVSPAKILTTRPKASAVFQNTAIARSSSAKLPTKPPSPLALFNLATQSTRPATSDITVSLASGVFVQPPTAPASLTPTIASSQHTESSSIPNPTMQMARFDTIVEGEEENFSRGYRGNMSEYKDLPMARLLEEYMGGTDGNKLSMEMAVTILVSMIDLTEDNIEKVEDPNRSTIKYKLKESLMDNLCKTTIELQEFIERAADLLEEWSGHFTINPRDTLLHILRGTMSLPQLKIAWKAIQKQLGIGHHTLQKYQQQYKQSPQEEMLLSPISTVPELHSELQNLSSADQRLHHLYQKFLHHNDQLVEDAETALNQGKSWLSIIPLPPTLKNVFGSEKEMPKEKQDSHSSKGKHKENREDIENDEADPNLSNRIWLGAKTPLKGPNKWFGNNRLRTRGPISGQTITTATKLNQNVLFGLAMP